MTSYIHEIVSAILDLYAQIFIVWNSFHNVLLQLVYLFGIYE